MLSLAPAQARDLPEIQRDGVLRHLGIPYAHFVASYQTVNGEVAQGLDVDLMRGFARHIGVEYQYVPATWHTVLGLLTGQAAQMIGERPVLGGPVAIEGDIIANGMTILPGREHLVAFSRPYFPSAVWLVARSDSEMQPIEPSGDTLRDIEAVKAVMAHRTVLAMKSSCLDPNLYQLDQTKAEVILPKQERLLNEMVPAILNRDAESTLLDVPDTLVALEKWPGEIKVIGPVSGMQEMGVAFRHNSPLLREAFNHYLAELIADGSFLKLAEKHFPTVFFFFPEFFEAL
ncbi:transporter substrate-binding domain-containing protein [Ferrimonas pelagia]|uniref:Transporter substrate-binding domain-containing protein n=2 Tax=Ferrimonas pelagia TaxID=1177826 RepID=A0ABP9F6P2_9GAMM